MLVQRSDVPDLGGRIFANELKPTPKQNIGRLAKTTTTNTANAVPCAALDKKYGNLPSGSMVWFVNKVAREFPDKIISTLAYWYTRSRTQQHPRGTQCQHHALQHRKHHAKSPFSIPTQPSLVDLQDWGKMSEDILIWDYNIQFANPVSPFSKLAYHWSQHQVLHQQ